MVYNHREPVKSGKLISAVVLAVLLGCKRNHAPAKEAVNGAFGWALGARLPAAFEVQTNAGLLRYVDPRGNVPPFDRVVLDLTTNRTIYAITDRKSTRLNSSHVSISYAVFCL